MSDAAMPGKSPYTKLVEKAFAQAVPLNCQIEITYRCNHLCTFCYNSPTGQPEMTTEQSSGRLSTSLSELVSPARVTTAVPC